MTQRIGNVVLIYPEEPQQCDECGKIDELRPYGEGGKMICFECGEKNPRETLKNMYLSWGWAEPTDEEYRKLGI